MNLKERTTPSWLKSTTVIWREDDAPVPDKELVNEAWQRFFGEPQPLQETALAKAGGTEADDWVAYRYRRGIVFVDYNGAEIHVERDSPWFDWTRDETGRSNSSQEFKRLAETIRSLLLNNGGSAISRDWAEMQGYFIMANLAHQHSLRPVKPPERKFK